MPDFDLDGPLPCLVLPAFARFHCGTRPPHHSPIWFLSPGLFFLLPLLQRRKIRYAPQTVPPGQALEQSTDLRGKRISLGKPIRSFIVIVSR